MERNPAGRGDQAQEGGIFFSLSLLLSFSLPACPPPPSSVAVFLRCDGQLLERKWEEQAEAVTAELRFSQECCCTVLLFFLLPFSIHTPLHPTTHLLSALTGSGCSARCKYLNIAPYGECFKRRDEGLSVCVCVFVGVEGCM